MTNSYLLLAIASGLAISAIPAIAQTASPIETSIIGTGGAEIGKATLRGSPNGVVLRVQVKTGGLTPGWHGMHFHSVGDCSDLAGFTSAKAHINSGGKPHGLLGMDVAEAGDLPNLYGNADGSANAEIIAAGLSLDGANSIRAGLGSALVIHAAEDDLSSQPIGNSGKRIACAVIK